MGLEKPVAMTREALSFLDSSRLLLEASSRLRDWRQPGLHRILEEMHRSFVAGNAAMTAVFFKMYCDESSFKLLLGFNGEEIVTSDIANYLPAVSDAVSRGIEEGDYASVRSSEILFDCCVYLDHVEGGHCFQEVLDLKAVRFRDEGCSEPYLRIANEARASSQFGGSEQAVVGEQSLCVAVRKAVLGDWAGVLDSLAHGSDSPFDPDSRTDWVSGHRMLQSVALGKLTNSSSCFDDAKFWSALNCIRWALAKTRVIDGLPMENPRFYLLQSATRAANPADALICGSFRVDLEREFDFLDAIRGA